MPTIPNPRLTRAQLERLIWTQTPLDDRIARNGVREVRVGGSFRAIHSLTDYDLRRLAGKSSLTAAGDYAANPRGPMARPTEKQMDAALSTLRSGYYSHVTDLAKDLIRQVKEGQITNEDEFQQQLHQTVDGDSWVIYTKWNWVGLLATDNQDQYFEEGLEAEGVCSNDGLNTAALLFAALRQDIVEALSNEGFDPQDEDAYKVSRRRRR